MAPSDQLLIVGPSRIGGFALEKELGRDGAGIVYAAIDERTDRRVALRWLPDSMRADPASRARALAGARALMGLDHPSLASIVEIGESRDGIFIASELAEGTSLRDRVAANGPLDLATALRVATDVASAIAVLHRQGRVHGALEAGRVILDDALRTKVVALGIAELSGDRGPRDDVRAIAAMLRESIDWRSAPSALDALVRRATDSDPTVQPGDADALLEELARIDLPVTPIGESVAQSRADVVEGASRTWIVGASVVLALVIALALFALFAMTQPGGS